MQKTICAAIFFFLLIKTYGQSYNLSQTDSVALNFAYTNKMQVTMACTFTLNSVSTNGLCTIMGITDTNVLKLGIVISNGKLGTYQVMTTQTVTNTIDVVRSGVEYSVVVPFSSYDALPYVFINGQRRMTSRMLYPSLNIKATNHQYRCFIGNSLNGRTSGIDAEVSRVVITNAVLGLDFITDYSGYGPAVTLKQGYPYVDSLGQTSTQIEVSNYRGVATNLVMGKIMPSCDLIQWVQESRLNDVLVFEPCDCPVPSHNFSLSLTNTLPLQIQVPFYNKTQNTNLFPSIFWKAVITYEQ